VVYDIEISHKMESKKKPQSSRPNNLILNDKIKKKTSIKKLKSTRAHSINLPLATWDQDKKKYFLKI
jgi:hypothetical protein